MLMKNSTELSPVSDVALICHKFAKQCKKKSIISTPRKSH